MLSIRIFLWQEICAAIGSCSGCSKEPTVLPSGDYSRVNP